MSPWIKFISFSAGGIEVCFIECVHVTLSLSVGASLELAGPPMHGKVTVDLDVVSFTIPFGDEPRPDTKHLLWPQFRLKYLYTDDPAGHAVTVHALEGLLPPEPAGAEPAPGTESQPWRLSSEWSFETTSTMAAQALMTRAGEVIEVEVFTRGRVARDERHLRRDPPVGDWNACRRRHRRDRGDTRDNLERDLGPGCRLGLP